MSLPVAVLKIIGPWIAKKLLNSFKIDSALQQAIDIDDIELPQNCSNAIDPIFKKFERHLRDLFEHEVTNVPANSRKAIVYTVAETLTRLQPETLAENNLNPEKITQFLLNANPTAQRDFTWDETDLYQKAISVVSQSLIEIAPEIKGVEVSVHATILQRLENMTDRLKQDRSQLIQAEDNFTKRYRQKVQDKLDRLEVFGLPSMDRLTSRQNVSMAYITLSVSGAKDFKQKPQQVLRADRSWEEEFRKRSHRIDEAICDCRRLVIRGAAGAGKSTLLQWLGVRAASQDFPQKLQHWNDLIPFFLRLRSLKDGKFPPPEEFIKLTAPYFAEQMPQGWVHDYLDPVPPLKRGVRGDRGQALVLIDGVDELPRKQRQDFFEAVQELVQDFPQATYVVTSRPSGLKNEQGEEWSEWEDWVKDKDFENLTLEPMSNRDVEEFIDRWHCALSVDDARSGNQPEDPTHMAESLKRQLRQRSELRRLASTPLLCAMICALHRDRLETLPSSRLKLYRECIEMLLDRRDKGRKIPLDRTYPIGLDEGQKIELLQSLALKLMRLNRSELDVDRVDSHFQTELTKFDLPENIAGKQIRQLFVDRAGLLRQPVVGQIDFAHRTFQEYLAAKAALYDDSLEELLEKATDDQWRESIIVAAGLGSAKERDHLLRFLIDRGNDRSEQKHYLHLLAVACLETATRVNPATRNYVLACAKKLLPPTDDDEVMMVARAGDRVVPLLKYESHYSAKEACQCIKTLVQIGTPAAMQTLVDYAKATFESEEQESMSYAIGRGWDVFDRHDYISQVLCHLQIIDLSHTQISDVSPLSGLTQLQVLDLNRTEVTDLSPLRKLTQLTKLYLSETEVMDLSPLSGLTQLQVLGLGVTQITDLSPLRKLTQLQRLYVWRTEVTDLSLLRKLTQLQVLNLRETQVTDLSPLSGLTQLQVLNLIGTQITDLSPLSGLTQLQVLNLSKTQVTDVSPLKNLSGLKIVTDNEEKMKQWATSGINLNYVLSGYFGISL